MRAKPVREGLFVSNAETGAVSLLGSQCSQCSHVAFPSSTVCPYCGSDSPRLIPLPETGRIELCTLVRKPSAGYRGPVPYGLAVIRLLDDLLIVAPVETNQVLTPGTPVRCGIWEVGEDDEGNRLLAYCFRPLETELDARMVRVASS